ncbi:hypothetical protein Taro_045984 [Colocasia esculenta]|uniref:Uncharacterized protein n=1 Tax=Colocasia esculenta TaxID=4460 RepID=A0A843X703_COLES|nr:hypothetical protein [Colocasia esculenta]
MFTREEDLPRARSVWDSTARTNFRKSMWEAQDKAAKITSSQDPTTWMDYSPVWMRRDYWESLCYCWATGPRQERSQAAKRNRAAHLEKNVHTSGLVFYATHNQKLHWRTRREGLNAGSKKKEAGIKGGFVTFTSPNPRIFTT